VVNSFLFSHKSINITIIDIVALLPNMKRSVKIIYDLYRNRADAENRIKEVKEDFGASSFVNHNCWATEAALNFAMMPYNLMNLC
jgi:hypothetical protein